MTSTNVNVGINENARSSSRVLRPPGGGHTDIFGGTDLPQVKKDNGRNASSIMEGTNNSTAAASPVKTSTAPPQISNDTNAPAQRTRIPPGGFSSGLW